MPKRKRSAKIRKLYHDQNGLCFWCSCKTVLYAKSKTQPNMATVEHLRDRTDPLRNKPAEPGEIRLVMACYKCNIERGIKTQAEYFARNKRAKKAYLNARKQAVTHGQP